MNLFLVFSGFLVSLIQVVSGSGPIPQASWDGDPRYDTTWMEFHKKVYSFGGEVLNPSEILRLLKILEEKYVIRRDEESVSKYKSVRNLLEIAEMDHEQCKEPGKRFDIIDRQFSSNRIFPNVVAFLNHFRDLQFSICQETLNNKLYHDIELLPKSIGDSIKQFKQSLLIANQIEKLKERAFRICNQAIIVNGVAHYLEHQLDPFVEKVLEGRNGVNVYNTEFNKLIREPCNHLIIEQPISIREFKLLARDDEMIKKFDPIVLEWFENSNICNALIAGGRSNVNEIRDRSLSQLLKSTRPVTIQKAKKNEKKGCLSCISSPQKYTISY